MPNGTLSSPPLAAHRGNPLSSLPTRGTAEEETSIGAGRSGLAVYNGSLVFVILKERGHCGVQALIFNTIYSSAHLLTG
jgi:hypothetical protein